MRPPVRSLPAIYHRDGTRVYVCLLYFMQWPNDVIVQTMITGRLELSVADERAKRSGCCKTCKDQSVRRAFMGIFPENSRTEM